MNWDTYASTGQYAMHKSKNDIEYLIKNVEGKTLVSLNKI